MFDIHLLLKRVGLGLGLLPTALGSLRVALLGTLLLTIAQTATAQTLTTLHSFTFGSNDFGPQAVLVLDGKGNLYGTTVGNAFGSIFELTPDGTEQVLHVFSWPEKKNGYGSYAGLIRDANGNLFGTTAFGGAGIGGGGTIFELTPAGVETVLHKFRGAPNDGKQPQGGLLQDAQGNLYGTTVRGGTAQRGTVFKVTPAGTETILYSFGPRSSGDGQRPFTASLIQDAEGNLYGTTYMGGDFASYCLPPKHNTTGCGAVFKVSPIGQETVLYKFKGEQFSDGWAPIGGLLLDAQGNLYGTTSEGGAFNLGTVFKVTPSGAETVVYSFKGGADGAIPYASLISDAQGNLSGTTNSGGGSGCQDAFGCGTVFKVTPGGTETVLYRFTGGADGGHPLAPLVFDGHGKLYGSTWMGGVNNGGTIFKLTP